MKRQTQIQIMEVLWPLFAAISFVGKAIYGGAFAWWLDPWLQGRANQALWDDIQVNLHFLHNNCQPLKTRRARVLPFDYASVCLDYGNVRFCFSRGREELHVTLSPRHAPMEAYELPVVIAAINSADVTQQTSPRSLSGVGDLLRPRLDALNEAFSESRYPEFKKGLSAQKDNLRAATKQVEWELNKRVR